MKTGPVTEAHAKWKQRCADLKLFQKVGLRAMRRSSGGNAPWQTAQAQADEIRQARREAAERYAEKLRKHSMQSAKTVDVPGYETVEAK